MGFLDKLFGKRGEDEDAPPPERAFNVEARREQLAELGSALGALRLAMLEPGNPVDNPGWKGRVGDLAGSHNDIARLTARDFTRDDMFEVLCTVRPLFRGAPPKHYLHLSGENERVIEAIEALHTVVTGE